MSKGEYSLDVDRVVEDYEFLKKVKEIHDKHDDKNQIECCLEHESYIIGREHDPVAEDKNCEMLDLSDNECRVLRFIPYDDNTFFGVFRYLERLLEGDDDEC